MSLPPFPPAGAQPGDPEPAAQAPDQVVLDPQALANLAQLDPTGANRLLQRVLATFRSSMARLLAQLAQARAMPDAATQRLVVHTLKSSAASVGAVLLSNLCGAAEKALRDGHDAAVPALLDQMLAEAARVDAAVVQLLSDE